MSDERGFSLVELMVVILLAGVIGSITTGVIVNSFHRQTQVEGRAAAIEQVRTALQRTVRELREAAPLLSFSSTNVALGETTDGGTQTVCYSVVTSGGDTSLMREVLAGTTPCPATPSSAATTVATHLGNVTAGTPVFSVVPYLYSPSYLADSSLQATVDPYCEKTGTSPAIYAPECVGSINIELLVRPVDGNGASLCPAGATPSSCDIDVSDSANLRNAP